MTIFTQSISADKIFIALPVYIQKINLKIVKAAAGICMIKVLELIDGGFIGGGQTHILSLAGNIDADKFKTVIAASPDGEFRNIAVKLNFEFEEIHFLNFSGLNIFQTR